MALKYPKSWSFLIRLYYFVISWLLISYALSVSIFSLISFSVNLILNSFFCEIVSKLTFPSRISVCLMFYKIEIKYFSLKSKVLCLNIFEWDRFPVFDTFNDSLEYFVNNLITRLSIVSRPIFNICGSIPIFTWLLYKIS